MMKGDDILPLGTIAPSFTTKDKDGKTISLSDFKGKYVLLDFWATWCTPCRIGNPHLIKLYNKYKSHGLEFIGISDDDKNVAGWKKAIADDGIGIWPQVLRGRTQEDEKGNSLDIPKNYKVSSYPTKILLDKDGKIVAQFTGEDGLDKLFESIFGQ